MLIIWQFSAFSTDFDASVLKFTFFLVFFYRLFWYFEVSVLTGLKSLLKRVPFYYLPKKGESNTTPSTGDKQKREQQDVRWILKVIHSGSFVIVFRNETLSLQQLLYSCASEARPLTTYVEKVGNLHIKTRT